MTKVEMAKLIEIECGKQLLVDGEPFPWLIAANDINVVVPADPRMPYEVTVTLFAERVGILQGGES
jgi:hypothetical protein